MLRYVPSPTTCNIHFARKQPTAMARYWPRRAKADFKLAAVNQSSKARQLGKFSADHLGPVLAGSPPPASPIVAFGRLGVPGKSVGASAHGKRSHHDMDPHRLSDAGRTGRRKKLGFGLTFPSWGSRCSPRRCRHTNRQIGVRCKARPVQCGPAGRGWQERAGQRQSCPRCRRRPVLARPRA
jgi:hypothetical protein